MWYINNYNYFILLCVFFILFLLFFMLLLLYFLCSRTSFLVLLLYDTSVKRSKSRSCLHDKAFELGTRQIWENSDLRSKSADFEYLKDCGSSVAAEQSGVSNEWQKTFWHSYHIILTEKSKLLYFAVRILAERFYRTNDGSALITKDESRHSPSPEACLKNAFCKMGAYNLAADIRKQIKKYFFTRGGSLWN